MAPDIRLLTYMLDRLHHGARRRCYVFVHFILVVPHRFAQAIRRIRLLSVQPIDHAFRFQRCTPHRGPMHDPKRAKGAQDATPTGAEACRQSGDLS